MLKDEIYTIIIILMTSTTFFVRRLIDVWSVKCQIDNVLFCIMAINPSLVTNQYL